VTSLLSVEQLVAGHGRLEVVRGLDLTVGAGEIVALLGPNGAGKTTTLLTLAGLLPCRGGRVLVDGQDRTRSGATAMSRCGLVLVPDDRCLFGGLTTRENLTLPARREGMSLEDVLDLFPQLQRRLDVTAGQLSGGEQQMLAIARSLVLAPRVLMVDELSMGLAPMVVETLLSAVKRVARERSVGVVLVEQHVRLALGSADRAMVLVHGRCELEAPAAELLADPGRLERAYLAG
jgi:branched-chain amino acid transport system ATP-binding protein